MLEITIPKHELFNDETSEFIVVKEQVLRLEHSLVSLSKWESRWHKSFLSTPDMTREETLDYIRCMTLTQNVDPMIYRCIPDSAITDISNYIGDPMTATTFGKDRGWPSREIITAEIIYYWMIALNIPFDCQKWHLNRLLTLIRVCNIKNSPPQQMSKTEIMRRNKELNALRKKQLNTKG